MADDTTLPVYFTTKYGLVTSKVVNGMPTTYVVRKTSVVVGSTTVYVSKGWFTLTFTRPQVGDTIEQFLVVEGAAPANTEVYFYKQVGDGQLELIGSAMSNAAGNWTTTLVI